MHADVYETKTRSRTHTHTGLLWQTCSDALPSAESASTVLLYNERLPVRAPRAHALCL